MSTRHLLVRPVAAFVLLLQLLAVLSPIFTPGVARAAESPLSAGVSAYRDGEFGVCVRLLGTALASGSLSAADRLGAYEYLARAYVRLGDEPKAIETFSALLAEAPDWKPDPDRVPPAEIAVFDKARLMRAQPPAGGAARDSSAAPAPAVLPPSRNPAVTGVKTAHKSKLMWIVGGVVAAGVGVAVGMSGGTKTTTPTTPAGTLPGAPAPPPGH